MSTESATETVLLSHLERVRLLELERALATGSGVRSLSVSGETYVLPDVVWGALRGVVHELAAGNGVTVAPVTTELTTQQAADLLDVSRPHLIQLLERGRMPFRRVGTHRRILHSDVVAFREEERAHRYAARERLAALSAEAGLEI